MLYLAKARINKDDEWQPLVSASHTTIPDLKRHLKKEFAYLKNKYQFGIFSTDNFKLKLIKVL